MNAARAAERHATGVAASADGRPAAAVRHLRIAFRQAAAASDRELQARILVSLAWAEAERGETEAGFRLLDEAEPLCPPEQRGILFGQRGLLLRRTGQDDAALAQYDAAIASLDERTQAEDLAKALSNRALAHLAAARIGAARGDLVRSALIAERHQLRLPAAVARHNLADLDLLRGDIPSALRGYAEAADVYAAVAPGKLATLAVDRARALLAAGLFGEADQYLAGALRQARDQRLSHVHADALLARAEAALLAGEPVAAARWASMARTRFLRRGNARKAALASLISLRAEQATTPPGAALATRAAALAHQLGKLGLGEDATVAGLVAVRVLIALGQPEEAGRRMRGCGAARSTDRLDTRMLARLARAELEDAVGRHAAADRELRAGMAGLHRYRSRLGCLDLQTGAAVHGTDLARAGLSRALAAGSAAAVFRWSERARAQALLLAPPRPPADPAAAAALEELRQLRAAARTAELAGLATALRDREAMLRQQIRQYAWVATGQPGGDALAASLGGVRTELGDAAMVSYLRDGSALHALVVAGGKARILPLGRYASAQEAVLRVRADLDAQAGRALPERLAAAVAAATRRDVARLGAALVAPMRKLIGDRDLVVVPTGALITVPWAMLGGPGRSVSVAPSATTWLDGARRARGRRFDQTVPALLASGPGNLRGDAEVAAVSAIRPGAIALTEAAATPAAVLSGLDGASVVHLAAHGSHQSDNALFSTLELAGGQLMGYDIGRLRAAPELVVLSCCDLGLADVRPGDEMLGMTSALLHAGTRTVVASVARVADDTAMRVMTGLHAALLNGMQPGRALALATADEPGGFVCFGVG